MEQVVWVKRPGWCKARISHVDFDLSVPEAVLVTDEVEADAEGKAGVALAEDVEVEAGAPVLREEMVACVTATADVAETPGTEAEFGFFCEAAPAVVTDVSSRMPQS
jgi:hypothetical protein